MAKKSVFKRRLELFLVPRLLNFIVRAIVLTCRTRYVGREHLDALDAAHQPHILCVWHANTSMAVWYLRKRNYSALVSSSHSGELIARSIELRGNQTVRGSSSTGGGRALIRLCKIIRDNHSVVVTPDGPSGPLFEFQPGALTVARLTNAPLIPCQIEASKHWVFIKSWDKHRLPKPFSTVYVRFGEPIHVARNVAGQAFEKARIDVEQKMMRNVRDTIELARNSHVQLNSH